MKSLTLATAGHIDHGKTALVRALTGTDTDTLAEEKSRGLTINLGYAFLDLADGSRLGVVDVPGHRDFIHNMLAGVAGIDLALLVVAADDGVMPQTREHLDILASLGLRHAVAVLTKRDLVDDETAEFAAEELRDLLAATPLADAPVVTVSATRGDGLDQLRSAIESVVERIAPRQPGGVARLPIDRVFTVAGHGVVVTGTLERGRIAEGDSLELLPESRSVQVKGLRVYRGAVDAACAGQRTAVNLARVERDDIERGGVLATPGAFEPTTILDVRLRLGDEAPWPLRHGAAIRFYLGATQERARAALLEATTLAPGADALAQLRLRRPVAAARGDRFVIRDEPDTVTIGGGVIIDAHPRRHVRRRAEAAEELRAVEVASTEQFIEREIARASTPPTVAALMRRLSLDAETIRDAVDRIARGDAHAPDPVCWLRQGAEPVVLHREHVERVRHAVKEVLGAHHQRYPLRGSGLALPALRQQVRQTLASWGDMPLVVIDPAIRALRDDEALREVGPTLALTHHKPAWTPRRREMRKWLDDAYRRDLFSPPALRDLVADGEYAAAELEAVQDAMLDEGALVASRGQPFHHEAVIRGETLLREYFRNNDGLRVSDFRNLTDSSRAYAIPLLNLFEARGLLVRDGDLRFLNEEKTG